MRDPSRPNIFCTTMIPDVYHQPYFGILYEGSRYFGSTFHRSIGEFFKGTGACPSRAPAVPANHDTHILKTSTTLPRKSIWNRMRSPFKRTVVNKVALFGFQDRLADCMSPSQKANPLELLNAPVGTAQSR